MENNIFLNLIRQKKQTVISITFLFVIIAIVITFAQPLSYAARAKLLVVQNLPVGTDAYVYSRTNEYLSTLLAKVIETNSFFNEVMNAGFDINRNYFSDDTNKQMKMWSQAIDAQPINDTGIISIIVYHPDKYQADQIIRAIDAVMKAKHADYHGAGDKVEIRIIDQPITSNLPVKPNIPLNIALGLVAGLIFSLVYIYLFPEDVFSVGLRSKQTTKIQPQEYSQMIQTKEHQLRNVSPTPSYVPRYVAAVNEPATIPPTANNISNNQKVYQPVDDIDILNNGSMQNIFGPSNLNR